jgi:acetylornithine deacetylase/succinyl-diaminopimelate desuccinylase-like protein
MKTEHSTKAASLADACMQLLDKRHDELVELARELVSARTENPPGGEGPAVSVVSRWLDKLELDATVEEVAFAPERPNLIATITLGGGSPTLGLCGHLDTVPVGDESRWTLPPIGAEIADERLHGRGSVDMKGAVAAMVFAAWALKQIQLPCGTLMLVFVADEEHASVLGAEPLAASGRSFGDAMIVGEPSGTQRAFEYVGIACRGVQRFDLIAHGHEMHSSLSDHAQEANASITLARAMLQLNEELPERLAAASPASEWFPNGPTLNVGLEIHGGVRAPVVPGRARAYCEIRTLPGSEARTLERCVEEYVEHLRTNVGLKVYVEFDRSPRGWLPGSTVSADEPIVAAALSAAAYVLGHPVPGGGCPGGTDARHFVNQAGVPALAALGPGLLGDAHGYDESVAVEELVQAAKIYAVSAINYLLSAR